MTLPVGFERLERFRSDASILEGDAVRPPTDAELAETVVAPGEDALVAVGLLYHAGWQEGTDGLSRHARAQARALAQAGLPVTLRSLPIASMRLDDEISERVRNEVGYLDRTHVGSARLAVRQFILHNPNYVESVVAPLGARAGSFEELLRVYEATVVYTSYERTTIRPEMVEVLNRCGEVWVPCAMNLSVFRANGVERVRRIPFPFEPSLCPTVSIGAPRGSESVPPGKRFYAIGKWEPRKNYHALVGAFLLEFSPKEAVSLLLKTYEWGSWQNYPSVGESLGYWLSRDEVRAKGWTDKNYTSRLWVVTDKVTDEEIRKYHAVSNLYVTCSHGEAWDLPAFDAKVAGNRLVYTGWGGAEDYATETDDRIVRSPGMVPVHAGYGWEPNALWASCPLDDIRAALRRVEPPKRRVQPPSLYRDFGAPVVGRMMLDGLRQVSPSSLHVLLQQGSFG